MSAHDLPAPGGGDDPAAARDHAELRAAAPGREELVDELLVAQRIGLRHAAGFLATAIVPTSSSVAVMAAQANTDPAALRAAVLAALRPRPERA
jgi:hypothetical protein